MSLSPNSSLVRLTIDLNYANKQRSTSFKWFLVNAALFLLLTYDLVVWCGWSRPRSAMQYVEAGAWFAAWFGAARHALRLLPRRAPRAAITARQQRLLGLTDEDLDSSFHLVPEQESTPERLDESVTPEPAALSPARSWRARAGAPPSPPATPPERAVPDEFIADREDLHRYLRRRSAGSPSGAESGEWAQYAASVGAGAAHQLASLSAGGAGGGAAEVAPEPARLWRRLRVEPRQLAQLELNLRRWLHATVLERVARELTAADTALGAEGLGARLGGAAGARLAALAAGSGAAAQRLRAVLPFVQPFADQQYVVERVRTLARGGCLAAYRWDGGAADWNAARPTDAELILHLLGAYLDAVVPGGAFRAAHVSAAPAVPGPLAVHRLARAPPHYVLALRGELLELPAGRHNLLHTLLLFVAAAAREEPPALCRLHLGPAGLNMLWILGR